MEDPNTENSHGSRPTSLRQTGDLICECGINVWNFIPEVTSPLRIIAKAPGPFICWVFILFFFGTFGFWYPLFKAISNVNTFSDAAQNLHVAFDESIVGKELSVFGIVILADGLGSLFSYIGGGKGNKTAHIRGVIGALGLAAFVLNAIIYACTEQVATVSIVFFQITILIASSVMAVMLYCLRTNDWERSVEQVVEEDDQQVVDLRRDAQEATTTTDGAVL